MSNVAIWSNLIFLIIGCVVGYGLGKWDNMKTDKVDPRGKAKRDKRNSSWWIAAAMIIAAVYIVITTSVTNARVDTAAKNSESQATAQAACNRQLIETINQRARINSEDLKLSRSDDLALRNFVRSVVTAPPEELNNPESTLSKLQVYNSMLEENAAARSALDRDRAASPYPSPDCGEG